MKHHGDKYGCEVERGDGYIGTSDVMQALGPCGCRGESAVTHKEETVDFLGDDGDNGYDYEPDLVFCPARKREENKESECQASLKLAS